MPNEKREVWFRYSYNDCTPVEVVKEKVNIVVSKDVVKIVKRIKKRK